MAYLTKREDSDETTKYREKVASMESQGASYNQAIQDAMDRINNREDFKYDMNSDALYNQYKDMYTNNAMLAQKNSIANAQAMTGGYGNSYAQMAGQAAYNEQMNNLNSVVPELYNLALSKYQLEGDKLTNAYNMATDNYSRYQNELNRYDNLLANSISNDESRYQYDTTLLNGSNSSSSSKASTSESGTTYKEDKTYTEDLKKIKDEDGVDALISRLEYMVDKEWITEEESRTYLNNLTTYEERYKANATGYAPTKIKSRRTGEQE